jgi:hypothetical protein
MKTMKPTQTLFRTLALSLLAAGCAAQAATVTGTVTNKTDNKPSAGDTVVLVDVQAGMAEAAKTTTDAKGRYSLNEPGNGSYLVRATHQGASYFIAAPQGDAPGDISVYDAAAKVDGIAISADVIEFESGNGQLLVNERYFVHNTSSPPRSQFGPHGFEVVLPADAVLDGASASRPGGIATNLLPQPSGQKGHFAFNFPIQPNQGDKETLFDLRYHLPYNGKYVFNAKVLMPADNVAVLMPKSMTFTAGAGASFQPVQEDPGISTFVAKNVLPGKAVEFTVSGNGAMPRENQGAPAGQQPGMAGGAQTDDGSGAARPAGNQPGGGIGAPIGTPDAIASKYKWWILSGLLILLAAGAAFLLRQPAGAPVAGAASVNPGTAEFVPAANFASSRNAALLNVLKEELFSLESEKLSGTLKEGEYAETKAALEIVLKRALNRK